MAKRPAHDEMRRGCQCLSADGPTRSGVHILLAEDDEHMGELLHRVLVREGYRVTGCSTSRDLLDALAPLLLHDEPSRFDLVVTDVRMLGLSDWELIAGVTACTNAPPVFLITPFGDDETHARARELGAVAVMDKPFEIQALTSRVRSLLGE